MKYNSIPTPMMLTVKSIMPTTKSQISGKTLPSQNLINIKATNTPTVDKNVCCFDTLRFAIICPTY